MGRLCFPDKPHSYACTGSHGHRQILSSYLCSIFHCELCGWVNACGETSMITLK